METSLSSSHRSQWAAATGTDTKQKSIWGTWDIVVRGADQLALGQLIELPKRLNTWLL
jgi:hypothetical protein